MGKWGKGLYENDIAEDLKIEFLDLHYKGYSSADIAERLINEYREIIRINDHEATAFWLSLADILYNNGGLTDFVRDKARQLIEHLSLADGRHYGESNTETNVQIEYQTLYRKLTSGDVKTIKLASPKLYQCPWKIGDAFAYQIDKDHSQDCGLVGRYLILIKTGECVWAPGHIIPICVAKISPNIQLPKSVTTIMMMESIQVTYSRMSSESKEDSTRNRQQNGLFAHDFTFEDGTIFHPHFHFQLITKSIKQIPNNLIFIGNIASLIEPFRNPDQKTINLTAFTWNEIDKKLIERYVWFNKRQASIFRANSSL